MTVTGRCSVIIGLVLFMLCTLACKYDDLVQVIRFNKDGSGISTLVVTNIRDDEKSRHTLTKDLWKYCADLREKTRKDGSSIRVMQCDVGRLPALFSKLVGTPSKGSTLNFSRVLHGREALSLFSDGAVKSGGHPQLLEVVHTPRSFRVRVKMKSGGAEGKRDNGGGSCSFMLQAPGPIIRTNADMVFKRYNMAGWNCSPDKVGDSYMVELVSKP